ncbi:hypothetical protein NL676_022771 [Syzygium grande]|nr:hypothetical protein NL676_022771 [Syzygium grande]
MSLSGRISFVELAPELGDLEHVEEIPSPIVADEKINECGPDDALKRVDGGTETSRWPFLMLELDLPPLWLFEDMMENSIIP